jgi:hypothetical protein
LCRILFFSILLHWLTIEFTRAVLKVQFLVMLIDWCCATLSLFFINYTSDIFWTYKVVIRYISLCNCCSVLLFILHCPLYRTFLQKFTQSDIFWDIASCSLYMNQHFGGTYHLHLQGWKSAEQETSESRWLGRQFLLLLWILDPHLLCECKIRGSQIADYEDN